jgi:hypothetical protein
MLKENIEQGRRFGKLTVVEEVFGSFKGRKFLLICDCGGTAVSFLSNLKREKHTKSCGCMSAKNFIANISRTHGMSKTKEYKCWVELRNRVLNPKHKYAEKYSKLIGGVQEEWKTDFMAFYIHIGPQPKGTSKRWSVGRIDNDVGYVAGNIRWEDSSQQARNKGKSKANSSGLTGVIWRKENGRLYGRAIARWYNLQGKLESKSFSEKHGGKEYAMISAKGYRDKMINELNLHGAGYSYKHGL